MKRAAIYLKILCLLCLLTACGKQEPVDTAWSEAQMAQAVWNAQGPGDYQMLRYGDGEFSRYVSEIYRIDPAILSGGAVFYAGGVSAREVAVLRLTEASGTGGVEEALQTYINDRAGAFAGYAPEEYAILEQSGAVSRGAYAALLIGPEQEAAREAFTACFTAAPPEEEPVPSAAPVQKPSEPEPDIQEPPAEENAAPVQEPSDLPAEPDGEELPEETPDAPDEPESQPPAPEPELAKPEPQPWSYSLSRLVSAWQSGDRTGLAEEDLAILAVCDQIPALTDSALSDYQRELALHDWMLDWAEYDPGALSNDLVGEPMPHNDDPYGFLTGKKGICLGYATTFQLLMEMSGVECTIVHGSAHRGREEHAWNMVKLDGELYCVDVTWDDPVSAFPVSREIAHLYFNVTSDFLRWTDHQWEEGSAPEATATDFAWAGD